MTKITTLCPEINLAQRKALLRELESKLPEKKVGQEFLALPIHLKPYYNGSNEALTEVTQALREYIVGDPHS